MQVHITDVNIRGKDVSVSFLSTEGAGNALWYGEYPKVGRIYEVEIEVPGILRWGESIKASEKNTTSISNEGDNIYIVGIVNSIDENGVVVVQIGNEAILVETVNWPTITPHFAQIKVERIKLFDIRL